MTSPASGIHDHPAFKLGKRPPKNAPALHLGAYLKVGAVPEHPAADDNLTIDGFAFKLDGNDRFGVCGPTSCDNFVGMVSTWLAGGQYTAEQDDIFDLYRRSGNPNFNPDTGAGDNGVDMQTMLEAWLSGGLMVTAPDGTRVNIKPVAFAKVDHTNLEEMKAAVYIFGGLLFGVSLQTSQQTQTDADPPVWRYVKSGQWGGHAICGGLYTGGSDAALGAISWAIKVLLQDLFVSNQLDEAWAVILPWHLGTKRFVEGMDDAALSSDYLALTGRDFPVQPAPGPVPAPPQPSPSPVPVPTDVDRQLAYVARSWLSRTLHTHAQTVALRGALTDWMDAHYPSNGDGGRHRNLDHGWHS